jgi:hypothetical protein
MASLPRNPFCGMKLHHAITVGLLCFIAVLSWNANEQRSMDVMVRQAHAYNATVAACPQQAACPACPAAVPAAAVECPASPECPPSTQTPTSTDICFKQEDFNSMFTARVVKPDGFLSGYLNAITPTPHCPTFSELQKTFFHTDTNVYTGFAMPSDMPAYSYDSSHVTAATLSFLTTLHPTPILFMLEVGSFIGNSAVQWGKHLEQFKGTLMCLDTWNGDINMLLMPGFVPAMARTPRGDARIYERFLNAIVQSNLISTVLPVRLSSITGARLVKALQYTIDVIYLDSAHEYGETFFELMMYWEVLKPGGVLIGDDYSWGAVQHDLDLFVAMKGLKLLFNPDEGQATWFLQKPV